MTNEIKDHGDPILHNLNSLGDDMRRQNMNRIITGQILMVLCCVVYLVWWYRGFRPGINVNRVGGMNGVLLLITAGLGLAGIVMSLTPIPSVTKMKAEPLTIAVAGMIAYIVLLLVTKFCFHRVVTTELLLIVGWAVLEAVVITRLDAAGLLGGSGFLILCIVVALAVIISMALYVAYYRMEEMKAFYAAMVPLVTEAIAMIITIAMVMMNR